MSNPKINNINVGGVDYDIGSTVLSFDTYDDYLDAHEAGDIPVGSTVFIKEGSQSFISANQVTYGNSSVKVALDQIKADLSDINKYKLIATPTLNQNVLLKLWSYTSDSNQRVNIQSIIQLASVGVSLGFSVKVNGTEVFGFVHGSSSPFQLPAGEYYDRAVVDVKTGDLIEIYTSSSYAGSIYSRTMLLSNVQFTAHVS